MSSMEEYQAIPALSAGGAWVLSEQCPALYWATSPLNPAAMARRNRKEFDIGTALHLGVLEPHLYYDRVVDVPFETYHTAEARNLRDEAWSSGKTPLKLSEQALVDSMRDAIAARPDVVSLFMGGEAERTFKWTMDGIPCKCRTDYLTHDYILDLKSVACAHPEAVARSAIRDGWHLRSVWYKAGVNRYSYQGEHKYLFVCVEKQPPYLIEVYQLDERAESWGELTLQRALRLFKLCRENNHWPGYDGHIPVMLSLPTFAEYLLADREAAGEL